MVLARMPQFDNWDWPLPLVIVFILNFSYAIGCQIVLSNAAAGARRTSLRRLKGQMYTVSDPEKIPKLQKIATDIEGIDEGAFAHFTQQPLATVLVSTVGLGIWQLLANWIFT
jgi:hypothetical protein